MCVCALFALLVYRLETEEIGTAGTKTGELRHLSIGHSRDKLVWPIPPACAWCLNANNVLYALLWKLLHYYYDGKRIQQLNK